jgi:hypothetical protein
MRIYYLRRGKSVISTSIRSKSKGMGRKAGKAARTIRAVNIISQGLYLYLPVSPVFEISLNDVVIFSVLHSRL